ncbi:MAG: CHAT domain-containing protein, partial [bacterium]
GWMILEQARLLADAREDQQSLALVAGLFADLYSIEGRWKEVEALLERGWAAAQSNPNGVLTYRLHWIAARAAWRHGDLTRAKKEYGRALSMVATIRSLVVARRNDIVLPPGVDPDESRLIQRELIELLVWEAEGLPLASRSEAWRQVRDRIDQLRITEIREYYRDPCLGIAEREEARVGTHEVEPRTAALHLVVLSDRIELLLSRGNRIDRATTHVPMRSVNENVERFTSALQKPFTSQYRAPGRTLYEWLIAPHEETLAREEIETLVFSATGSLGGLPFGALVSDGGFLIEQFAIVASTGASLSSSLPRTTGRSTVVAAGVVGSDEADSPILPGVARELEAIRTLTDATVLIDQDFRVEKFAEIIAREAPSIVHIASHGRLGRGAEASYIETWQGELGFDELSRIIRQRTRSRDPIDLLVLSACDTATDPSLTDFGLAGVALRSGARGVVGTLWPVDDDATRRLMTGFYRMLREASTSKAIAMREAQISLLSDPDFRHPYHWSGFVFVNDWR